MARPLGSPNLKVRRTQPVRISLVSPINRAGRKQASIKAVPRGNVVVVQHAAPASPPHRVVATHSPKPVTPQTVANHQARHTARIAAHRLRVAAKEFRTSPQKGLAHGTIASTPYRDLHALPDLSLALGPHSYATGQHNPLTFATILKATGFDAGSLAHADTHAPSAGGALSAALKLTGKDAPSLVHADTHPPAAKELRKVGDALAHPLKATGHDAASLVHADTHPNSTAVKVTQALEHPVKALRDYNLRHMNPAKDVQQSALIAGGLARAPLDIAKATAQDPKGVLSATAKSVPKIAAGLIPGIVEGAADPLGPQGVQGIEADLKRRYGASSSANVKRIKQEGIIPEALDVAAVGSILGHGAGAIKIAKRQLEGADTARPMRPAVRVSHGVVKAPEPYSRNVFKAAGQKAVDIGAEKLRVRRVTKAKRNEAEGARQHPVDVAVQPGERTTLTRHGRARAVRIDVADRKGRNVVGTKREIHDTLKVGARKAVSSLSKPERRAFSYGLQGLTALDDPAAAVKWLDKREEQILAERGARAAAGHPVRLPKVLTKTNEELHTIGYLRDHADAAFTPALKQVVEGERKRIAANTEANPSVSRMQQLMRKGMPQRILLDQEMRAPRTPAEAPTVLDVKAVEKSVARNRANGEKPPPDASLEPVPLNSPAFGHDLKFKPNSRPFKEVDRSAPAREYRNGKPPVKKFYTPGRAVLTDRGKLITNYEDAGTHADLLKAHGIAEDRAATFLIRPNGEFTVQQTARSGPLKGLSDAELGRRVMAADRRLVPVGHDHAALAPKDRPQLRITKTPIGPRRQPGRAGSRATGKVQLKPLRRDTAEARSVTTQPAPGNAPVFKAGRDARLKAGLPPAAYFPHERSFSTRFSDYAAGSGGHAVSGPKQFRGELFTTGRAATHPEVYYQGLARGIKVKRNWNFVAESFRRYTDPNARSLSFDQLQRYVDDHQLNPAEIRIWNPGLMAKEVQAAKARGIDAAPSESALRDALTRTTFEGRDFLSRPGEFQKTKGWAIADKAAFDEINASAQGEHLIGRVWTKFGKSVPSRLILGTSPVWAVLQVLNDSVQAAFAGVTPFSVARKEAFLRQFPELRRSFEEYSGGGGVFQGESQAAHIGSVASGPFAEWWRSFRQTPVMESLGRKNPLDVLFRFDNFKANQLREAVLYTKLKRDAFTLMGDATGGYLTTMRRLEGFFGKDPVEQMRYLADHQAEFERAGHYVDDIMGNFSRYTERERRYLGNNIMFYGFLRFSLRWTFYTLPVKHPIIASILTHLSTMHEDEVRKLAGAGPNDPLPPGALSTIYLKGGKWEIPLQRLSPAENVITQATGVSQLAGAAPPLLLEIAQQIAGKNFYKNRPYLVHGENQGRTGRPGEKGYSAGDRALIALKDVAGFFAPYTAIDKFQTAGAPQGDDSLFGNRPTLYKDPKIRRSIAQSVAQNRAEGPLRQFGEGIFPLIPRPSNLKQQERTLKLRVRQTQHKKKKPRQNKGSPLGGGGLSNPLGGAGGGNPLGGP